MNIALALNQSIIANIAEQRRTGNVSSWRNTNILRVFDFLLANDTTIPLSLQRRHLISVTKQVETDTKVKHHNHVLPNTEPAYAYSDIHQELNTEPICLFHQDLKLP